MNDPTSAAIAVSSFLRNRYPDPAKVLGASLGTEIRAKLPEVNIKLTFGGLRSLINGYLRPFVREMDRSGSDCWYLIDFSQPKDGNPARFVHQPTSSSNQTYTQLSAMPRSPSLQHVDQATRIAPPTNLWAALTNPKVRIPVYWDSSNNELIEGDNLSASKVLPKIQPITLEEHCTITQEYLAQNGISIPLTDADPSDVDTYVPRAVNFLRKEKRIGDWEGQRTKAILRTLANRLENMGASNSQIPVLLSSVIDAKPHGPWFSKLSNRLQSVPVTSGPAKAVSEEELREFIIKAVKQMSLEELRELKISGAAIEKSFAAL